MSKELFFYDTSLEGGEIPRVTYDLSRSVLDEINAADKRKIEKKLEI